MTMEEYEHEFARLSRFTPDIMRTEETKTERFINGLNWDIQGQVSAHTTYDYAEAVRVATILYNANGQNTRGPNNQQGSKTRFDLNSFRSQQQAPRRQFDQQQAPREQFN